MIMPVEQQQAGHLRCSPPRVSLYELYNLHYALLNDDSVMPNVCLAYSRLCTEMRHADPVVWRPVAAWGAAADAWGAHPVCSGKSRQSELPLSPERWLGDAVRHGKWDTDGVTLAQQHAHRAPASTSRTT